MSEFKSPAAARNLHDDVVLSLVRGMGEVASPPLESTHRRGGQVPAVRFPPAAHFWLKKPDAAEPVGPSMVFEIGEKIGRFGFIELGRNRAKLVCAGPSACDLDHRFIARVIQRSAPGNRTARVVHDPTEPCRQKGGDSCTYLMSW